MSKRKAVLLTAALICTGALAAAGSMMHDKTVNEDIPLHDGDVLVDSLNVQEEETSLVASDDVTELENTDTYFQEMRATLDMDRNKIISMLTDAENSAASQAEKAEASSEKMKLLGYMEQEKTIETLIKNKGLPDSFVVITDKGVNVTVNTEDLDQNTVTKICEIIIRQTDRKASEIVVQDIGNE